MITFRQEKGTSLTYQELDTNFGSFFYSSSFDSGVLKLFYTGSSGVPVNQEPHEIKVQYTKDELLEEISNSSIPGSLGIQGNLIVTGSIEATEDIIAFTLSDIRLKDSIVEIKSAGEKVKAIRGVEFDWNKQSTYRGHDVGVIAQEVELVLPEAVQTRSTGIKAVNYEKLIPLLIQAIKELQHRVEVLESK